MKEKIIKIFLLCTIILFTQTNILYATEDLLTLSKVKELALKNSVEIMQAELDIAKSDKAKRDADEAYTKAQANYFVEEQKPSVTAAREAYRAALNNLSDKKVLYENTKGRIEYKVEELYLSNLNLENEINNMEIDLKVQSDSIEIERIKLQLGMTTQQNVNLLVQRYLTSRDLVNSKKNILNNNQWSLNKYIGYNTDQVVKLVEVNVSPILPTNDQEQVVNGAKEIYLALKQLSRTISEKEKDIEWYGYNMSDKVEDLRLTIRQADLNKKDLEYGLQLNIENIYNKIDLLQRNILTAKSANEVADTNYKIMNKRYEIGLITKLDLQKSMQEFEVARYNYQKLGYDYYLAVRELDLIENGISIN